MNSIKKQRISMLFFEKRLKKSIFIIGVFFIKKMGKIKIFLFNSRHSFLFVIFAYFNHQIQ